LKLFNHFGSAVAIAFSDIDGKAKAMNHNQKLFVEELKTIKADSAEG